MSGDHAGAPEPIADGILLLGWRTSAARSPLIGVDGPVDPRRVTVRLSATSELEHLRPEVVSQ